jgi:hypothetical protein
MTLAHQPVLSPLAIGRPTRARVAGAVHGGLVPMAIIDYQTMA